jgi:hypothetical protein
MMTESQLREGPKNSGPPLPAWLYRYLINPLMKSLLRSRFHGRVSHVLMLLRFKGRKSGKEYSIPVGYLRDGEEFTVMTESPWWKNLQNGAEVQLLVQGETIQGRAFAKTDRSEVAQAVMNEIEERGPELANRRLRLGLGPGEKPTLEQITAATGEMVVIRIQKAE